MSFERLNGPSVHTEFDVPQPNGIQSARAAMLNGQVPGARMAASAQPANADVAVTIGGKGFTCKTTLAAAGATVQFLRGASAAATYANLVDAINGNPATKGTKWVEATTAFAAAVVADMVTATQLRLRNATARGGLPLSGISPTLTLAAAVTAGATAWSVANLNATGKDPADMHMASGYVTITAAMVTAGFFDVELEFQPTVVDVSAFDATGLALAQTELVTIPTGQKSVHMTIGTGLAALVATNVVYWSAQA